MENYDIHYLIKKGSKMFTNEEKEQVCFCNGSV